GDGSTSRRDFLKLGAAGAVGASVGAGWRPRRAEAKPAQITVIRESSYVKEFDEHFKNVLIPRYQQETGIKLNYEIVAAGGSAVPRNISIVESKAPVDAGWLQQEWLVRGGVLDVSGIGGGGGEEKGGGEPENKEPLILGGKWKSGALGNIGQVMVYRKDWFDQIGATTFPDTWEEFYEVGVKLKKAGHPYGMSMGHGYADNNSWLLPLLWGFGAQVVAKDGKTITLDSN